MQKLRFMKFVGISLVLTVSKNPTRITMYFYFQSNCYFYSLGRGSIRFEAKQIPQERHVRIQTKRSSQSILEQR